jgi:threonine/homoserine/homoserine lactone efflux protein
MLRARGLLDYRILVQQLSELRWVALAGVGAANLVVYWLGLVRPYSLAALGLRPHVDIASLTRGRPQAQLSLWLTYVALLVLYYLGWRLCRNPRQDRNAQAQRAEKRLWATLLLTVAAINLAMSSLYPIGAVDVFD